MKNKRLIGIVVAVAFLLLIPFIAMKLTGAPNWSRFDFILAGILLLGTGLAFELVMRIVKKTKYRIALCGVILATLLLVWIELAVGLFGTRFAGN
jgi:hypothetical protein